jgi:hypothetical protein
MKRYQHGCPPIQAQKSNSSILVLQKSKITIRKIQHPIFPN